jgi:ABC-2 type transport system ATP-binding protein
VSARRRAHELVEALDLSAHATRKVSELSGGQRRRLDVALGLVHAPQLLFLDEPSTGLDPQNRANLWDHILRLRAEHEMTIMLTTHYLDEADTMAERVVVVDHGQVIADDTADGLKRTLAGDRVVLTTTGSASVVAGLLDRIPGARDVTVDGSRIEARVADAGTAVPELVIAAAQAGAPLLEALAVRPTLDDVFLALTGRSLRDEGSRASDEGQDAA